MNRDCIGHLEDLLKLELINKGCWNPNVVVGDENLAININQKKKQDVLQTCSFPLCDKCNSREHFFYNHLEYSNKLGKYDFSCGTVVNNLKEMQLFSDQMNRNYFDLILAKQNWNCSPTENLRCLNSAVNERI